ncbi:MAG TPA: Hpt domain-containing protein, partial [Kofleriaceae bacterium]|nr:Hpt domain-containing protein [Kofleriaceae bacterium]
MERALLVGHPMQSTFQGDPTARFIRTLPERVTAVCAAITTARSKPSAVNMAEARRGVHQLAGTAGSFERHDIGRAARAIESGLLADPVSWAEVERGVAELVSKGALAVAAASTAVAAEKPAVPLRHASAPRVLIVDPAPGALARYLALFARQVADITCVPSAHVLSSRAGQRPWDVIFGHASTEPGPTRWPTPGCCGRRSTGER